MKQLLFYYLYFVGASLVLIECAKLFPSNDRAQNKGNSLQVAYNKMTVADFLGNGGNIAGSIKVKAITADHENSTGFHSALLRIHGTNVFQNWGINYDSVHLNNTHKMPMRGK